MKGPHEDQATRERILAVASRRFATQGYRAARLQDIASDVGIQKASLFHHFPSKAEIYRAVLAREVAEIGDEIRAVLEGEGASEERLRAIVAAYVHLAARQPERTKLLLRLSLGDAPVPAESGEGQAIVAAVADFIAAGQRRGCFRPLDPQALVLAVVGMVAFFFTTAEILWPGWGVDADRTGRVERAVSEIALRALSWGPSRAEHDALQPAALPA